jgi:putative membrane protein insertion efficiency factor
MSTIQSFEVGWINNLPFFKAVFRAGKAYKIPRSYAFPFPEYTRREGSMNAPMLLRLSLPAGNILSMNILTSMARRLFILLVKGYQLLISPFLGNNCRYYPTCSQYTIEAIELHGIFRGTWLGIRRISRCHPFHEGGIDPVPGSELEKQQGDHKCS